MVEIKNFPNNQDVYRGAEDVMRWFYGRTSGVFGADGNARVSAFDTPRMAVQVSDGTGWMADKIGIGCVWWIDKKALTGTPLYLAIDAADAVYHRIDRVIVEWSTPNYTDVPVVRILPGTSSSKPSAPALTNDSTTRQISLARISIKAGATEITSSDITDERLDKSVCGLVSDSVSVDTEPMHSQFEELLNSVRSELNRLNSGTEVVLKSGGVQAPINSDQVTNKGYVDSIVKTAAPHNLLDNSDFRNPVNQRGVTDGVYTDWAYFLDRWRGLDNANVSLTSSGLKISSGKIAQSLPEGARIPGKTYTFAVGLATGDVRFLVYTLPSETVSSWVTFGIAYHEDINIAAGGDQLNHNVMIEFMSECTIVWAALYEGEYTAATLPEYQPKGYGAELAECQRYFWRYWNYWKLVGTGIVRSDGSPHWTINHPVSMRIAPTITIPDISLFVCQYGANSYSLKTMRGESSCFEQSEIIATIDATLSKGEAVGLIVKSAGIIDFSADL